MGLGNFFSKSKAKSIEVNGVKYSAPKDGICSIKVEEGKVFVNGEEATKEIIEKSPIPKTSSKKEIHFDELKVVFNGVENTNDNTINTDLEKVDIEVNNYKFEDVMSLNITSKGDITIFGNVEGDIDTDGLLDVHGNVVIGKTDIIAGKNGIYIDGHLIQLDINNEDCQDRVFLEDNSLKVTKDLIANVRYDSSKANNICVGGTFMGKISDTSSTPLDSWADITIKGKANGEIHTITQGDIRIGEE